ncbi:hypothetical protein [Slackia isoflavoniconvertens]|uniref:hypothetical protein n=1 Tax=Slackia isoflavoniconvertens TaxID=572010 RepID=UPI003FD874CE
MYDKHTEEQEQAAHRPKPGNEITAKSELVLERLLAAHGAWFDVSRDVSVAGRAFRALAQFHSFGEQYVLVKRVKLWEAEEHEYMLFDVRDHIDAEAARSYVEFMKNEALELVKPEPNHMSSFRTLVVIANSVSDEAYTLFRKTSHRKNFMWGIRGWSDVRLALIDLSKPQGSRVVCNGAAKRIRKSLEANATDTLRG